MVLHEYIIQSDYVTNFIIHVCKANLAEFMTQPLYILRLENCACKKQVMPPCPKPALTPSPILTHDPQHIQSILETNV